MQYNNTKELSLQVQDPNTNARPEASKEKGKRTNANQLSIENIKVHKQGTGKGGHHLSTPNKLTVTKPESPKLWLDTPTNPSPHSTDNAMFTFRHMQHMDSIYELPVVDTFDEATKAKQRYREQFGGHVDSPVNLRADLNVSVDQLPNQDVPDVPHARAANHSLSPYDKVKSTTVEDTPQQFDATPEYQETVATTPNMSSPSTLREPLPLASVPVPDKKQQNESAMADQPNSPTKALTVNSIHSIGGVEEEHKWKSGDIVDVIIRDKNNLVVQGVIRSWNPVTSWADIQVLPDKHHGRGGDMLRFVEVQDMRFTGLQLNDIAVLYFDDTLPADRQYPPGFMLPFEQLLEENKFEEHVIQGWQDGTLPLPKPSVLFNDIKVKKKKKPNNNI
ncbi:hypothetical protein RFI_31034 [Reticulomyxa filosa]|uniref:Uncharacterized protein n=1 Tax=Reticulomyxa filosa TaxID=46433 RepID=X6M093_RETFI|nr:hypothetical protein RFI_31034 [Reticulomyxa filosa]|eukprot:ETO06365.1 hypothetical protein RFI_31034 [Reticulomyxa filosa]